MKITDKARLWLLILAIVVVGGLIAVSIYWILSKLSWRLFLVVVMGYFVVFLIVTWANVKWKRKCIDFVYKIVSVPMTMITFLVGIMQPFMVVMGTYILVVAFSFGIPALLFIGLRYFEWLVLKPETIRFLVLAIGSIICAHCYSFSKWIIHHSSLRDWGNHKYESYRAALALYLIKPSNVIFILYFLYFIFLAISGYLHTESGGYLVSEEFDASLLQAFLVFVAFTNMRTKAKDTEIEAKELLDKMMGLFVHDE